jgi:hypothetical protein
MDRGFGARESAIGCESPALWGTTVVLPSLLQAIVLLLLLNACFALAEFAAVKIRPTWVEELERQRHT